MKSDSGALRHFGRIKNGTTPASGEADYWDGEVLWATPEDLGKLTSDRYFPHQAASYREGGSGVQPLRAARRISDDLDAGTNRVYGDK